MDSLTTPLYFGDRSPSRREWRTWTLHQRFRVPRLTEKANDVFEKLEMPMTGMTVDQIVTMNVKRGHANARRLALTTPIADWENWKDLKATNLVIEFRKENIKGQPCIVLYGNGKAWPIKPKHQKKDNFNAAHDVFRHMLLKRNRTSNLYLVSGEILTGQFKLPQRQIPMHPEQYDGLIANLVNQDLTDETRDNLPQYLLEQLLDDLQKDEEIPVGAKFVMQFRLPPPDITYIPTGNHFLADMSTGKELERGRKAQGTNLDICEPVYTGHPYEPISIEKLILLDPKQNEISEPYYDYKLSKFLDAFSDYQQRIEAQWELGALPLDKSLTPSDGTLLFLYNFLKAFDSNHKWTDPEAPIIPEEIQLAIQRYMRQTARYPERWGPIEEAYIASFPPPPFHGKVWRAAHGLR